jgi:hypothetical protein
MIKLIQSSQHGEAARRLAEANRRLVELGLNLRAATGKGSARTSVLNPWPRSRGRLYRYAG